MATPDQTATEILSAMFKPYGLESFGPYLLQFYKQGFNTEELLMSKLRETAAYKQRFSANETRRKNGYTVLSEREYLAAESSYRSVLRNSGLPTQFYDSQNDINLFLSNDVSPAEVQARAKVAMDFVNNSDPNYINAMWKFYGVPKEYLAVYAMDPSRALPIIEDVAKSAKVGAEALRAGMGVGANWVNEVADADVSASEARAAFNRTKDQMDMLTQEAVTSRTGVSQGAVAKAELGLDTGTAGKVKQLKSQIRGRFSGGNAGTAGAFGRGASGLV